MVGRGNALTYSLLVLSEGRVDYAHVEENLAGVLDLLELDDGVFKLIVVVATQGSNPGLDFLCEDESVDC